MKDNVNTDITEIYKKRFRVKEKTLTILTNTLASLDETVPKEVKTFFNIANFVNIVSYDLMLIGRDLLFAERKWQKKHYSRQAALLIYETINDLFDLLGNDFKRLTEEIQDNNFELNMIEFRKKLNEFKVKNHVFLKEIRNITIAHRDKDSIKQINSIITIDDVGIIKITFEFEKILHELEENLQLFHRKFHDKTEIK